MRSTPFRQTVATPRATASRGLTRLLRIAFPLAFLSSLAAAPAVAGQTRAYRQIPPRAVAPHPAAVRGRVIDAASGAPLGLATVRLERSPYDEGAADPVDDGTVGRLRSVVTDAAGEYRFEQVHPGLYRLRVRRAGYRPALVDVEVGTDGGVSLTVGLQLQPFEIRPIEVRGEPVQPYHRGSASGNTVTTARVSVAANRQERYLAGDVRALTASDVRDAVTLAEADIFRALQRLPGVGRRDDYTAVLWTRGAPWPQTRVYFDGMPLYNPTHGGWLFSSVNPDGVGAAFFHPGVRSAAWGEGAAGVLDLQSRSGGTETSGRAELSLASARLGADGSLPGGIAWMLAGRRTYVDVLTSAWDAIGRGDGSAVPYDFSDVIARVDVPIAGLATIEASGTAESDNLRGDVPDIAERNRAKWGNRAGRVTLEVPLGPARLRATAGGTRFSTHVEELEPFWLDPDDGGSLPDLSTSIDHDRTAVTLDGGRASTAVPRWAVGYESIHERWKYDGPLSLTGEGIPGLPRDLDRVHADLQGRNRYDAWWGEVRLAPVRSLAFEAGVRLEVGDSVLNAGDRRWSPRLSARWRPVPQVAISGGWGRSFQYSQAIGASAGPIGPQLHLGNVWIIAGAGYPAVRADIGTFGVEAWLFDGWLLSAQSYLRRATGIAEPDPTPGELRAPDNNYVLGENVARGLELSVRRLAGRWTGSIGYGYGDSEMTAVGLTFPGSADIRHTLDVTGAYRVNDRLRIGAAFSYASGVPYTRVVVADPPRLEEPGARRTPAYASLDLLLDYTARIGDWNANVYLQLLNTLNRRNAVTYTGSREICRSGGTLDGCASAEVEDDFTDGLPFLPLIGIRIDL